jgi:hypothetical protein
MHAHFFDPQSLYHRFWGAFGATGVEHFRDSTEIAFVPLLMCLIWILTIFLEYALSPGELEGELQRLKIRLQRHGLDRSGSTLMLSWVLLRKEESLELHPRSWVVVRFINVIKTWDVSRQRNLTALLLGYLRGNLASEPHQQQYKCVIKDIMEDLATLAEEMDV